MLKDHETKIKYKIFRVSVSFLFFQFYSNSKVHTIKNNFVLISLSIWYTIISLLFGWWGGFRSIKYTLEAIHVNLSGGIDFTEDMNETEYDDKTNYIWNNLLRKTIEKVKKDDVEIIIEIQEDFEQLNKDLFTNENIDYIYSNLSRIKIYHVTRDDIKDVFHANKLYLNSLNA